MTLQALRSAKSPHAQSTRAPFMAFVGDEVTRAILLRLAQEMSWPEQSIQEGSIDLAVSMLGDIPTPKQLIIDISEAEDPLAAITTLSEVCDAGTQLIALGQQNDVDLYRGLMALGVQDYLLKPISPEALTQSLKRLSTQQNESSIDEIKNGELICVVGARGGVGASTVAINMAWVLSHEFIKKTALVDLDLYFGSHSLALDLESGRGFREALEHPECIDGLFIERAMVRQSENLFVLSAEEDLDRQIYFDGETIAQLFEPLRSTFDYIVVEIPHLAVSQYQSLLSTAAANIVVTDSSLAGLRDSVRLAALMSELGGDDALDIIVNKAGLVPKAELSAADFARESGLGIKATLPFVLKIAGDSMAAGKPMIALQRRSKLAAVLRGLCQDLLPAEAENLEKKSFWRRKSKKRERA